MDAEVNKQIALEIAHVLFIDIVAYSKLSVNDQHARVEELNQIVRASEEFREAESAGRLLKIATGDGMALVFYTSPEAPAQCAVEISRALKEHSGLQIRMGIHSGPVSGVVDVNERTNVAGAGINMAQRVMDCGDAGHILLSKHVAEDLEHYEKWRPLLHDLGTCEVKHGVLIGIANLYDTELGNAELPRKLHALKKHRARVRLAKAAVTLLVLATVFIFVFLRRPARQPLSVAEKSIAVLPFENLSSDQANAYFADGVQDEILTDLAKIADLKVISRTSVMQYKTGAARNLREIGQQLGVAHLLEGSVQRAGNKVRVNAQLIDARTDAHQWAENYDRPLDDVFAIQSEIAKAIADQLQAKLSPSEKAAIEKAPTADLAAYDLYLRAQALYAKTTDPTRAREELPAAARLLNKALARDSQFLLGWCLLANIHTAFYQQGFDHTPTRLEQANAAVQTALRLQPDAGEPHLAAANYYYLGFRDYERARTELALARLTLPNSTQVFEYTGYIDRRQGSWENATRNLERALELDPRNFYILQQIAGVYDAQRRYPDEIRVLERALTIVPGDPATRIYRAQVELDWKANIKPFQTTLATILAENPSVASDVDDDPNLALCERTTAAADRVLTNYPREGVTNNGVNYPYSYWEGVVARCESDGAKAQAAFGAARAEVERILQDQPDFAAALVLWGRSTLASVEKKTRSGKAGAPASCCRFPKMPWTGQLSPLT